MDVADELREIRRSLDKSNECQQGILQQLVRLQSTEEDVETLNEVVLGNGSPEKGLAARVPKLEDRDRRRDWLSGIAITAGLGALFKAVVDFFGSRP